MDRDEDSRSGRGYTAKSYIEAFEKGLIPFLAPELVSQQYIAKAHVAKATEEWFETHGVCVEDWPAHSPDVNPIGPARRWLKVISRAREESEILR
jgi:hypothetical protein